MPHKPLSPNLIKDIFMQTWQGPEKGTLLITKAASGWAIATTFASFPPSVLRPLVCRPKSM